MQALRVWGTKVQKRKPPIQNLQFKIPTPVQTRDLAFGASRSPDSKLATRRAASQEL